MLETHQRHLGVCPPPPPVMVFETVTHTASYIPELSSFAPLDSDGEFERKEVNGS